MDWAHGYPPRIVGLALHKDGHIATMSATALRWNGVASATAAQDESQGSRLEVLYKLPFIDYNDGRASSLRRERRSLAAVC